MEEENGLELSLGLSCGGSSAIPKAKHTASTNVGTEDNDRGSKIIDDFKNFLHGGSQRLDLGPGSSKSDSMKPEENFFNDLSQTGIDGESLNLKDTGMWVIKNESPVDIQAEKQPEVGNKRKILLEEINRQKKHEGESSQNVLGENRKASHISTTEDGSAAENEDVGESEREGSTSRPADLNTADLSEQKRFNSSSGNEMELHNFIKSVPFTVQTTRMLNMIPSSPVKESHVVGESSTTGHSIHGMRQVLLTGNGEQSGVQNSNPGNVPLMFGYPSGQLPSLDKDNSRGLISHPQFQNLYPGRGQSTSGILPNSAEVAQYDARTLELAKVDSRQNIVEEGSSSQAGVKGSISLGAKDSEQSTAGLLHEFSAIKPGLAADVKFGGCGSFPNLPWVSTTSPGPNGKTISGVTYRYNANDIKIVCACHGAHMSPDDFVRHASEDHVSLGNEAGLDAFSNKNPSTSTQS